MQDYSNLFDRATHRYATRTEYETIISELEKAERIEKSALQAWRLYPAPTKSQSSIINGLSALCKRLAQARLHVQDNLADFIRME